MSPTDSRVLLAEVGAASPPPLGRSAMKMARSRARDRLRQMVEKPGWWVAFENGCIRARLAYQRRMAGLPASVSKCAEGIVAAAALAVALTGSGVDPVTIGQERVTVGGSGATVRGLSQSAERTSAERSRVQSATVSDRQTRDGYATSSSDPAGSHWLQESLRYPQRDARQAGEDANQLGRDAEQLGEDATQIGEDLAVLARYVEEDARQLTDDAKRWIVEDVCYEVPCRRAPG